jgi:hypothetical protein
MTSLNMKFPFSFEISMKTFELLGTCPLQREITLKQWFKNLL